ncbi:MAG: ribosome biogenesis GTPase YlqF [Clostridia bacterium]|nr:ribosome biogenesis GTPase YlqF [Clostridia bacterium]
MNIQWYPGHMAKTRRLLEENVKIVDAVVEILDARIPYSSRNPNFDDIVSKKPRLILLNKCDMADEKMTDKWVSFYKNNGVSVLPISCLSGFGIKQITPAIFELVKDKTEKYAEKGINKSIKIMIVGIPNVGKSTVINRLVGKAAAKTGDRPGVTTSKQWIRIKDGLELLDTPGILPPKFEDQKVALKLAYTGAIRDEIMEIEEIVSLLLEFLRDNYSKNLSDRYILSEIAYLTGYELLKKIGKKRGCLVSGGEIDETRTANIVLEDFRSLKLGRITLENTEDINEQ